MPQAAFTSPYTPSSYLTTQEYRDAPTAVDVTSLKVSGGATDQDAVLATLISRASSWADEICNQILAATVDIEEQDSVRFKRNGTLYIHTDNWPVLEVRDFQYATLPSQFVEQTDLSNVAVLRHGFRVLSFGGMTSSLGPLQLGMSASPNAPLLVRYTYVNGYPNTTLVGAANAGDTTVTVADSTGIYGGPAARSATSTTPPATVLTIFDSPNTERVSVASVSGNTLTLNAGLAHAHTAGVSVSALPPTVKQAVVLLTTALIKERGTEALVMDEIHGAPHSVTTGEVVAASDIATAKEMLSPFARVR